MTSGPSSARPRAASLLGAGLLVGLSAGCLDLSFVADVVFPATVPGLPSDQPWVSLPVGAWLVDGAVEPRAISACVEATCQPQAAVGLFRATGPDAARLASSLADPAGLLSSLAQRRSGERARSGVVRTIARVAAEPYREGAFSGIRVRLTRPDGSRPASGIALAASRAGALTVVVIVAAEDDAARRLARDVAGRL